MSTVPEKSDEQETEELGYAEEQFTDNQLYHKLMKLPHAVILQKTEDLERETAKILENTKRTVVERKKIENEIIELKFDAMTMRQRRKKAVNEVRQYCSKLEDSQALYNSMVEPFNEHEITRRENAKKLSEVSNKLSAHEKVFDVYLVKSNQNTLILKEVLAEKKIEVENRKSKLKDLNDKLEQRKISMKMKLEKRNKSKNELLNLNVDGQTSELNSAKAKLCDTKRLLIEIQLVCKDNDLKINAKSQEVHEVQIHVKTIQDEIEEKMMRLEILEQRIKNEKSLVLQRIQSTMKQEWEKVDQANLNIAAEMNLLMKKRDESEILMQLLVEKKQSLVETRQNVVQEQAHVLMEVEKQRRRIAAVPIINPAFQTHIEELREKMKESVKRKLKQDEFCLETRLKYEDTLKVLIQQQDVIQGLTGIDNYVEDKINSSSSSKGFSQSSDIQQIEKIDVTVMSNATMNSFSPCTSTAKLNKKQAKLKKNQSNNK